MLLPRLLSFGVIPVALYLPLASVACDSMRVEDRSPSGRTPNGSDPSGNGGDNSGSQVGNAVATLALSSCVPSSYALPLSIGDSEPFDVTLDTGSTSIGVASSSCTACDVDPKFSPEASVVDQGVQASSRYAIGAWSGEVYEGDVSLDSRTRALVKFVAIQKQQDFFVSQTCGSKSGSVQGILGLGPGPGAVRGTNGFLDRFVAQSKAHDVFATKLCADGGTLWLGGFDGAHATSAPKFTPMLKGMAASYAVGLANVDVDGTKVPVGSTTYPGTIVDTGSSVFLLSSAAFAPLTKAIAANSKFKALVGEDASWFNNPDGQSCKKLSSTKGELDASLPPLTLTFGTGADAIEVRAAPTESYLTSYDGQWCSTLVSFEPSSGLPVASIMGAPVMRSNIVIFDRESQRIGFAPHTPCN